MKHYSPTRARQHALKETAYGSNNPWKASKLQVFLLLEDDFLYQCKAFKHVVPAKAYSQNESEAYMGEKWRRYKLDLGHFTCRHCRQFAKEKFCEEVSLCVLLLWTIAFFSYPPHNTNYLVLRVVRRCHGGGGHSHGGKHATRFQKRRYGIKMCEKKTSF